MYLTTALSKVVALDAENGHERWKYDPYAGLKIKQPRASGGVNRGVAYWSDGRKARIFLGASDGRLISLDANTGLPDPAFGKLGTVDLREGMEVDLNGVNYGPTSAPAVYRDIVILGNLRGDLVEQYGLFHETGLRGEGAQYRDRAGMESAFRFGRL